MVWFLIRSCAVETTGRATTATRAIHSSMLPCSLMKSCGDWAAFIRSTRLPTKAISATSITAPAKPATSSMANAGQIGLMKWT